MVKPYCKFPEFSPQDIKQFWDRVEIRDVGTCWLWIGNRNTYTQYGIFWKDRNPFRAHRMMYFLNSGIDPLEKHVLHHCDNPPCVNPEHLFIGTQLDNMRDKVRKGRQAKGDKHGMKLHPERVCKGEDHVRSIFTQEEAEAMRQRYNNGEENIAELARSLNAAYNTIYDIIRNKHYKSC